MRRRRKDTEMAITLKGLESRGLAKGTKGQMDDWYARLIFMPVDEVRRFADNERVPVICSVSAKALLGKKGFTHLTAMQERLYGKPTEHTDITTNGGTIGSNPAMEMPFDELKRCYDEIIRRESQTDRTEGDEEG